MGVSPDLSIDEQFSVLFRAWHRPIFRCIDRASGDPELAAELAQQVFLKLHGRRTLPDRPEAWLISTSLDLLRRERPKRGRRRSGPSGSAESGVRPDAPDGPAAANAPEAAQRVRAALDALDERERVPLLLRAEGFGYGDIAAALGLKEASIGKLLTRARAAFRTAYREAADAR